MDMPRTVSKLMCSEPSLAEYVEQYMQGTPLRILEIRIRGAFGKDLAERFSSAFRTPSTTIDVQSELEGSLGQKHGLLGNASWTAPQLATRAQDLARPGYDTSLAHEYLDTADVLREKVALLASLIRKARKVVIYAGAGLSTASGVGDYATRTGESVLARVASEVGQRESGFILPEKAKPNLGHFMVSAMTQAGLVWQIVQQNHDGLLQKAGVPQKYLNEIHGSWFDPGNPVVKMSETLRPDLYEQTCIVEQDADLILVLGSSLAGMNTDRIVRSCATRALHATTSDPCLGSVIVSLQRTPHDSESSLRIFSTIDSCLQMLAIELGLHLPDTCKPVSFGSSCNHGFGNDVFLVPYDSEGILVEDAVGCRRTLDLRDGAELLVTIGADKGQRAIVLGKYADGHYKLRVKRGQEHGSVNSIRYLGLWWIEAAVRGDVPLIPLVTP